MRIFTNGVLAAGLIAGGAALSFPGSSPAQAQGVYFDAPGVHVGVGEPRYRRHYRRHYNDGYYAYDYGPRRGYGYYGTYNGCRPGFTVQDGRCKPYRGY